MNIFLGARVYASVRGKDGKLWTVCGIVKTLSKVSATVDVTFRGSSQVNLGRQRIALISITKVEEVI